MLPRFKDLLTGLIQHRVRFVVIGGMAMISHGTSRPTYDLDICYERSPENLTALAEFLQSIHARLVNAPADLPFRPDARTLKAGLNFTFETDLGRFDILGEIGGIGLYDAVRRGSVEMEIHDVRVHVMGLDDLIRSKKFAGRVKDRLALLDLEELRRLSGQSEPEQS
jgi:hypothetical protein